MEPRIPRSIGIASPAPCNESYVSYACANSTDGIVYEPIENWLGALLPENATEIPPVPEEWYEISSDPDSNVTANVRRGDSWRL